MDGRKNNGAKKGGNKGAGRPSKSDENKAQQLIKKALHKLYNQEEDDDNTIMFLHDFAQTPRGQQFIAEHLIGKPKEHVINEIIMDEEIDLSKYSIKNLKESIDSI